MKISGSRLRSRFRSRLGSRSVIRPGSCLRRPDGAVLVSNLVRIMVRVEIRVIVMFIVIVMVMIRLPCTVLNFTLTAYLVALYSSALVSVSRALILSTRFGSSGSW